MIACDDIEPRLVEALRAWPLRLAVLFGSAARGTMRSDSDADIGILAAGASWPLRDELDLQLALERACGRPVDVVRLDEASPMLRWRAATEGRVLLSRPAYEWPRFVARAGIEHGDLEPLRSRAAERFRRALAAGRGGS